jgi:hypothetical protein
MKKFRTIVAVLLGLGLASFFLFYAGAFRDNRDPLSVIDYVYACLANHEPFLIYSVSDRKKFDYLAVRRVMEKHFLKKIASIRHEIAGTSTDRTLVKTTITYRDHSSAVLLTELKNQGSAWQVNPDILAERNCPL